MSDLLSQKVFSEVSVSLDGVTAQQVYKSQVQWSVHVFFVQEKQKTYSSTDMSVSCPTTTSPT